MSTYPRFVVNGMHYQDAEEAANAFNEYSVNKAKSNIATVEVSEHDWFEIGGVDKNGEKYLNDHYFQHDPLMRAFKSAYQDIVNPFITNDKKNDLDSDKVKTKDPSIDSQYPKLSVGEIIFSSVKDAVKAFASFVGSYQSDDLVKIHLEDGTSHPVAGFDENGKPSFQDNRGTRHPAGQEFLRAFDASLTTDVDEKIQPVVQDVSSLLSKDPDLFPQLRIGELIYHDMDSALKAFEKLDSPDTDAVRLHLSEKESVTIAGVNFDYQRVINDISGFNNPIAKAFQDGVRGMDSKNYALVDNNPKSFIDKLHEDKSDSSWRLEKTDMSDFLSRLAKSRNNDNSPSLG